MKFLEQHSQSSWFASAIIMEEGDYNLDPSKVRGMHVDYIFIPEEEIEYYTTESPLYNQLLGNISIAGNYFGQILTYKPLKHEHETNS